MSLSVILPVKVSWRLRWLPVVTVNVTQLKFLAKGFINVFAIIFIPLGLPRYVRHRLPEPPLVLFGEALLCAKCRQIFEKYESDGVDLDPWTTYRFEDDLGLLRRSADANCHVCIKLLDWVSSIENGPDWSNYFQERLSWLFCIRAQLFEKDKPDHHYEILFHIARYEEPGATSHVMLHQMRLKIIPYQGLKELTTPNQLPDISISDESLELMKRWLRACDREHSRCKNESVEWLPTRLINVGIPDSAVLPHLCSSSFLPKRTRYLTLSHCWGKNQIFRLLNSNIVELQQSLPFDQLPKTFQEAIQLAQALDIHYIWIDSLCIIQDSDSDWAAESMTMGDVYANSYCNIAATGAPNGEIGLSFKRNPGAIQPLEIRIPEKPHSRQGVPTGSYYCMDDFWQEGIVKAPLNQRAWVFQEWLLSRRVLNFGSKQLFWECKEGEACEVFPASIPHPFAIEYKRRIGIYADDITPSQQIPPLDALLQSWCDIVTVYTNGQLTKQSDKLVAISAVAQRMDRFLSSEYLEGLWRVGMPGQLLWWVRHPLDRTRNNIRQQSYQGPSWSWASIDGDVNYLGNTPSMEPLAEFVKESVELLNTGKFGAVSGAYVQIRGYLSLAEFVLSDELLSEKILDAVFYCSLLKSEESLTVGLKIRPDTFSDRTPLPLTWETQINDTRKGLGSRVFYILPLCRDSRGSIAGLILKRAESSSRFERIGMFVNDHDDYSEDEQAPILRHRPMLDSEDYEKYNAESGQYTVNLV